MSNAYTRKLSKKSKYTYTVVIPKEIIDEFRWQDSQKLTLKVKSGKKIEISDWKPSNK